MSKLLKNIKRLIVKQIKKEHPNFQTLNNKKKKEVIEKIWGEVRKSIETKKEKEPSKHELLNVEAIPTDILTITRMQALMQEKRLGSKLFLCYLF